MKNLFLGNIFSGILLLVSFSTSAQFNCETLISEAEQAFELGKYDTVITNIERGLKECHLSREDKQKALELLVKTEIEKDNPEERDKAVVRLLKHYPNYELSNPESETSFNIAIQKYSAKPFISFGLGTGFNFPFAHIETVYSILDDADYSKSYNPRLSYLGQTNMHLEIEAWKFLSFCFEPGIATVSYSRTIHGPNNWKLTFIESLAITDWMGFIKGGYQMNKVKIFAEAGFAYSSFRSSSADVELNYVAYNSITQTNDEYQIAANKIDLLKDTLRVSNMNSFILGLGASYRKNKFIFSLDVKYMYSKDNLVKSDHRFQNELLTFDYYYVDNDFDMNRVQLQAGISYIFYYRIVKNKPAKEK